MIAGRGPRPYADPYVAGIGLGLVLLGAFVMVGRGLGASGAFASAATGIATAVAPEATANSRYFASYLAEGSPWQSWLLFEIAGVLVGGYLSARLSGRVALTIDRGPRIGGRSRLVAAAAGGATMGLGAVLARGCTSGQALTGGALLSAGSWGFMLAAFAAAFGFAPLARRLWR